MNSRNFSPQIETFRRFLLAATFIAGSLICAGQNLVAVAPGKMNVFYTGVDNPITVGVTGNKNDDITVTISGAGGSISKVAEGKYNVHVTTVTDDCLVNVYRNGKLEGSSNFKVRNIPRPTAMIGSLASGSTTTKAVFESQPGISVVVKDAAFVVNYEVVSFSVVMADDAGKAKEIYCTGAAFCDLAKQSISQYVKPGDLISIQKILVKEADGKVVKLPALVYSIK